MAGRYAACSTILGRKTHAAVCRRPIGMHALRHPAPASRCEDLARLSPRRLRSRVASIPTPSSRRSTMAHAASPRIPMRNRASKRRARACRTEWVAAACAIRQIAIWRSSRNASTSAGSPAKMKSQCMPSALDHVVRRPVGKRANQTEFVERRWPERIHQPVHQTAHRDEDIDDRRGDVAALPRV